MASASTAFALLLNNLLFPHKIEKTLNKLKKMGITENILRVTDAREKISKLVNNYQFGDLARSLLSEWEEQIKEFSLPLTPPPSPIADDLVSMVNELLEQFWDSSKIRNALSELEKMEITANLVLETDARKKIFNVITSRSLTRTSLGERAIRLCAKWSEDMDSSNRSPSIKPVDVVNGRKRRASEVSTVVHIKKSCLTSSNENSAELPLEKKLVGPVKMASSSMILRSSSAVNAAKDEIVPRPAQKTQMSEDRLREISANISKRKAEKENGMRMTFEIPAASLREGRHRPISRVSFPRRK